MLKVLHINLGETGLAYYGFLFAEALSAAPNVDSVTIADSSACESEVFKSCFAHEDVVSVPWNDGWSGKAIAAARIIIAAIRFRPDIVHDSQGAFAKSTVTWLILRAFAPIYVTQHDPRPHVGVKEALGSRFARRLLRHVARHVFVHGPVCKQSLVRDGVEESNITVIRHGNLSVFDNGQYDGVERNESEILFFGVLRVNKGVDLLPAVVSRVVSSFPKAKFTVAGSAKNMGRTSFFGPHDEQALLETLRTHDSVLFRDEFIPDNEVELYFRRAGITLLPYREATQSGVAMIAMALGSVVVATNVGDLPFVIEDGVTGFLCEPTVESIASRLCEVLVRNDLDVVRDSARKFVLEECSWTRVAESVCQVYSGDRVDLPRLSHADPIT